MTFILLFPFILLNAQTVTHDDFNSLIPYLQTENWKSAFKESSKILKTTSNKEASDLRAIVLYINIFSAAGMVSEGQMSYKKLEKNVMKFRGQKIIMAAHRITTGRAGILNKTYLTVNDTTNTAFTAAANIKGVNILCFEKFLVKDKINVDKLQNRVIRCGGTLENIELNPNKSTIWILRLTVTNAFVRKAD